MGTAYGDDSVGLLGSPYRVPLDEMVAVLPANIRCRRPQDTAAFARSRAPQWVSSKQARHAGEIGGTVTFQR